MRANRDRAYPGQFITDVSLTNEGTISCTLGEWASVVLRGNAIEHVCMGPPLTPGSPAPSSPPPIKNCHSHPDRKNGVDSPAPVRFGRNPSPVVLDPGRHTSFSLLWRGTTCLLPAYRADVRVPGSSQPLGVVFPEDTSPCLFDGQYNRYDEEVGAVKVHVTPIGAPAPTS